MILHRIIRRLAGWALWSFFREIHVVGEENVPREGPVIVVSTHHNMLVDPAVLSSTFPHKRPLHYWAKSSLFKDPIARKFLTDTGNIPVDRKSKDNQVLFRGTFHVLAAGKVVALFPEGTSYTETRIMQVKDGASWSALEFTKWAMTNTAHRKPLAVIPAGIVYTNKSKYRSRVVVEFGKPITMKSFEQDFLSDEPGMSRAAVKRLTAQIESELVKLTINAPDWETLYAARMARDLLWTDENRIRAGDFVAVSQTLVDLFSTPTPTSSFGNLKRALLTYHSLLQATRLTNSTLSGLPLPDSLNPSQPTPLPSRLSTLLLLLRDSLASLVRLPFFFLPLLIHLPAYAMSRLGARLVEDEEETQAQNKIIFALLLLLAIYPAMFLFLWALFWLTPIGAILALALSYAFVLYHNRIVDDNYEHAKRLVAVWRVLLGVWMPKKWDLSLAALQPYTIPYTPPVSDWIDKSKATNSASRSQTPTPAVTDKEPATATAAPTQPRRRRRPSASRRLIRHVLRARSDAARLLAAFFVELERNGGRVRASSHLVEVYGQVAQSTRPSTLSPPPVGDNGCGDSGGGAREEGLDESGGQEPRGWRDAREVVRFLRDRGGKIGELGSKLEGDWAAANSDVDGETRGETEHEGETEPEHDLVFVNT